MLCRSLVLFPLVKVKVDWRRLVKNEVVLAPWHACDVDVCPTVVYVHDVVDDIRACRATISSSHRFFIVFAILSVVLFGRVRQRVIYRLRALVEFVCLLGWQRRGTYCFHVVGVNVGRFRYAVEHLILTFVGVVVRLDSLKVDIVALARDAGAGAVIEVAAVGS